MLAALTLVVTALGAPQAGVADTAYRNPNTVAEATPGGELLITPLHHGAVLFQHRGVTLYVDPFGLGNAEGLPLADAVLITHQHPDHFDPASILKVSQPSTVFVVSKGGRRAVGKDIPHAEVVVLENGASTELKGIGVRAVPAYNVRGRDPNGGPYHRKGVDNGYVLDFQGRRVYVAGDTEKIKEMAELGPIDVAFLPTLAPYCMDEAATLAALELIKPRIFYTYHTMNPFTGARADVRRVVEGARALGIETRAPRIY